MHPGGSKEISSQRNTFRFPSSDGDLDGVCALARRHKLAVVLGVIEAGEDRGGHTLYCSSVFIDGAVARVGAGR